MSGRLFKTRSSAIVASAMMLAASIGLGQQVFYHLLAGSAGVSLSSASQNFSEANGTWSTWPTALSAWSYRRELAIPESSELLTNFTLMVKLDGTRIDYSKVQALGQDIRFTDVSGNLLPYEIETWNPAGTSTVWVRVPNIAAYPARTRFYVYYGNTLASDAQVAAWDANYSGVWHLNGSAVDSTAAGGNGTITGATGTTGLAGQAMSFSGASQYIRIPDSIISNSTVGTVETWFKTTNTDVPLIGWSTTLPSSGNGNLVPTLYVGSDGFLHGQQWNGTAPTIASTTAVNDGQWHHAVLTFNGNTQTVYLDGAALGTLSGNILTYTAYTFLGTSNFTGWPASAGGWRYLNGQLDESRISTVARTNGWITATYRSVRDELLQYGIEELPSTGVAPLTVNLASISVLNVTVPYTVTGTAASGVDYVLSSGNAVITAGSTSAPLGIPVFRDNVVEGTETVIVTLGTPTNAPLGAPSVHTLSILDETLSPPDAVDDLRTLTSLVPLTISVLGNDTDAQGDPLQITSFTSPASGTVVRVGGTIVFTPSGDFGGTDSFTYTITDGRGGSDTATITLNYQIPFTWTGAGGDALWTNGLNWIGGTAPGASDTATFNNQCSTNCNPLQTAPISVRGVRANTSYVGTIQQAVAQTFTVGTFGWLQRGGTFIGSNAEFLISAGSLSVLGASSFTATTGRTYWNMTQATSSTVLTVSATSTLVFPNSSNQEFTLQSNCGGPRYQIVSPVTVSFYNLTAGSTVTGCGAPKFGNSVGVIEIRNDFYYSSNLGTETEGVYHVYGNVISNGPIVTSNSTWWMKGATPTTYGGTVAGTLDQVIVDKGVGSFTPAGGVTAFEVNGLEVRTGSMTLPATFRITKRGTVIPELLKVAVGASLTVPVGSSIDVTAHGQCGGPVYNIDVDGSFNFENLSFVGASTGCGGATILGAAGDTFNVKKNLTLGGSVEMNINFDLEGSLLSGGGQVYGPLGLNFLTNAANVTAATGSTTGFATGPWVLNKTGRTTTLQNVFALSGAGQPLTVSAGVLDLNGRNLTVAGIVTVASGAKILCSGATLTAGSYSVQGEISCGTGIGITWTGAAGDGLWTTAGNWTNGNIPGASDIALFNAGCTNCNASINTGISVRGISLISGYTGTLTQNAAQTINLGSAGLSIAAGTFNGSDANWQVDGPIAVSGGTWRATSTNTTFGSSFAVSGAPTFNHNNGTVIAYAPASTSHAFNSGSFVFNNFTHTGEYTTYTISGTLTVNGSLSLASSSYGAINGGTIDAKGNVTSTSYGKPGSTVIRLSGSTNQTITGSGGNSIFPSLELASTGGTISLAGNIIVGGAFTNTSGAVSAGTSTVTFVPPYQTTRTYVPGSIDFNHVTMGCDQGAQTITGTMKVLGTLTLADSWTCSFAGTIHASGDVVANSFGKRGAGLVRVIGSGTQTITGTSNAGFPNFEIASTGTVNLSGTLNVNRNYTYTSGTVNAGTSTLLFAPNASTSVTYSPGAAISYNNVTIAGESVTQNFTSTLNVLGTLSLGHYYYSNMNGSTILAYGDVVASSYGNSGPAGVRLVGTANRILSGTQNAPIPDLEIATTAGQTAYSGTLNIRRHYTVTSGTVNAGTSTLILSPLSGTSATYAPGTEIYNNVSIIGESVTQTLTGSMYIAGLTSYSSSNYSNLNGGTVRASGDVASTSYGKNGSSLLLIEGATSTILSNYGYGFPDGAVTINKAAAGTRLLLTNNVSWNSAGQNLTITRGYVDMAGNNLTINNTLTVGTDGTLICNGGTLTRGSLVNSGTVDCGVSPFTWTGNSADGLWSTASNWMGGVAPGGSDIAVFSGPSCGANCAVTINSNISVKGIRLSLDYSGTITQGTGVSITLGTSGFYQLAGTFLGSNGAISSSGTVTLRSGSFRSTSGIFTVTGNFVASGTPTFTHNSGTFDFVPTSTYMNLVPNSLNFWNLRLLGSNGGYQLSTGTINVFGTLTFGDSVSSVKGINDGIINLYQNMTASGFGYAGTVSLNFIGTSPGNISVGVSAAMPPTKVTIAKSAVAALTLQSNFSLNSGGQDLDLTSGILDLNGNVLTVNDVLTVGAFGTLTCRGGSYTSGSLLNTGTVSCGGYAFLWTGAGGNANWTTAGNWQGGAPPGNNDLAIFNSGACGANCNATINSSISVGGILMETGFTGTMTQASGASITLARSYTQLSGTFVGEDSAISIGSSFGVAGGSFKSTSNLLTVRADFIVNGGATFDSNSGSVTHSNPDYGTSVVDVAAISLNNFTINSQGYGYGSATAGAINVLGLFTCQRAPGSGFNGGTISARGNILINGLCGGSSRLRVAGSSSQTFTNNHTANGMMSVEFASTGGTVTFVNNPIFTGDVTYTSGTINWASATMIFRHLNYTTPTLSFGAENLQNVIFDALGYWYGQTTIIGSMNVNGNLTCNAGTDLNTGLINVIGDITIGSRCLGSAKLRVVGSSNQTFSTNYTGQGILSTDIAKTGGIVTFANNPYFQGDVTYVSGVVEFGTTTIVIRHLQDTTQTLSFGSLVLSNLRFVHVGYSQGDVVIVGTINVTGNLTLDSMPASGLTGGAILVGGSLQANVNTDGTTQITLVGANPVTISGAFQLPGSTFTINKSLPSTAVTLASNMLLTRAGQQLNVTTGALNMSGQNLTVASTATLNGNTLTKGGGVLSVNGSTIGTGAQLGGTVAP